MRNDLTTSLSVAEGNSQRSRHWHAILLLQSPLYPYGKLFRILLHDSSAIFFFVFNENFPGFWILKIAFGCNLFLSQCVSGFLAPRLHPLQINFQDSFNNSV